MGNVFIPSVEPGSHLPELSGSHSESMPEENLKVGEDVVRVFEQFLQDELYISQLLHKKGLKWGRSSRKDSMTREA